MLDAESFTKQSNLLETLLPPQTYTKDEALYQDIWDAASPGPEDLSKHESEVCDVYGIPTSTLSAIKVAKAAKAQNLRPVRRFWFMDEPFAMGFCDGRKLFSMNQSPLSIEDLLNPTTFEQETFIQDGVLIGKYSHGYDMSKRGIPFSIADCLLQPAVFENMIPTLEQYQASFSSQSFVDTDTGLDISWTWYSQFQAEGLKVNGGVFLSASHHLLAYGDFFPYYPEVGWTNNFAKEMANRWEKMIFTHKEIEAHTYDCDCLIYSLPLRFVEGGADFLFQDYVCEPGDQDFNMDLLDLPDSFCGREPEGLSMLTIDRQTKHGPYRFYLYPGEGMNYSLGQLAKYAEKIVTPAAQIRGEYSSQLRFESFSRAKRSIPQIELYRQQIERLGTQYRRGVLADVYKWNPNFYRNHERAAD